MKLALALGLAGLVLMLVLELPLLGVPALFGFIVAGVFAIADPEELRRERSD